MNIRDINNFFGDMDLFLMDLILKGKVHTNMRVLDVGCGTGRNGIFFIQNGYDYHAWDTDKSKLGLLQHLAQQISTHQATFEVKDLMSADTVHHFDLIICSRLLHFAKSREEFIKMWKKLSQLAGESGIIYASLDSAVDNTLAKPLPSGLFEFPDGKVRFALTQDIYEEIRKGFREVEPLRTLAQHDARAQSFFVLQKMK